MLMSLPNIHPSLFYHFSLGHQKEQWLSRLRDNSPPMAYLLKCNQHTESITVLKLPFYEVVMIYLRPRLFEDRIALFKLTERGGARYISHTFRPRGRLLRERTSDINDFRFEEVAKTLNQVFKRVMCRQSWKRLYAEGTINELEDLLHIRRIQYTSRRIRRTMYKVCYWVN